MTKTIWKVVVEFFFYWSNLTRSVRVWNCLRSGEWASFKEQKGKMQCCNPTTEELSWWATQWGYRKELWKRRSQSARASVGKSSMYSSQQTLWDAEWIKMFADDFVICSESREQTQGNRGRGSPVLGGSTVQGNGGVFGKEGNQKIGFGGEKCQVCCLMK